MYTNSLKDFTDVPDDIIEIKNLDGKVIFTHTQEFNTIKKTVEEAVRRGISLERANLRQVNLPGICLRGAILKEADLSGSDIRCGSLMGVNMKNCIIRNSIMTNAHIYAESNISGADFSDSDLHCCLIDGAIAKDVNFTNCHLKYSHFIRTEMDRCDFSHSNIINAVFDEVDLCGADFSKTTGYYACFLNCNVSEAKHFVEYRIACPSEGSFIGWKKIHARKEKLKSSDIKRNLSFYDNTFDALIKLQIPEDAKRCSALSNKCRCDKAVVLEITNLETNEKCDVVYNIDKDDFEYKAGETVYPDSFDDNRWIECTHGIHFFVDKQSAINY